MENIETIEKLAEGYSTQSKTTNQFWLVLIITSIIAITGQVKENQIALPFTLGTVSTTDFYAISIILISVLTIAYTSAMAQAIRARMLIQLVIDKIDNKIINGIHLQDFLDAILTSPYNRVAPISQFILGKKQFLGQGKQNNILRIAGIVLYVFLKLSTYIFMYYMPVYAIYKCFEKLKPNHQASSILTNTCLLFSVVGLAFACIVILLIGDIKYLYRTIRNIYYAQ